MPVSATQERILLNQYHLTTLDPTEWPHEADEGSDEEDDDDDDATNNDERSTNAKRNRSNTTTTKASRIQKINRHASLRSSLPGGQAGGQASVQKDEPDALGMAPSVAAELRKRGLPVEEDLSLRNRFMLSSTTFNPQLYLSQVHQTASTADLLRGLEYLSKSIEQKSASLKVLVESNFERFVRAKATIDSVYTEMRTQGVEESATSPNPAGTGILAHSRHTSRGQSHFRNQSGTFGAQGRAVQPGKKKTALTKESEYGVAGIKTPLQEVAIKAEEVWGPALGGREKEETLKAVMAALEQHKDIFRVSGNLYDSIKKNDFEGVIDAYKQAKQHVERAKRIAELARDNNIRLGEADAQQIIVTARMWHDATVQTEEFKNDVWKRLKTSHGRQSATTVDGADKEQHMELIGLLLQLGVDENPIWEWINSRYLYLKEKIARSFERSRIEIEIQRRKLTHITKVDDHALARHLRSASSLPGTLVLNRKDNHTRNMDSTAVILFWEKVYSALSALLSSSTGILGEVLEWWEVAQSFITNQAQKSFPVGVFAAGLEHLQLDPDHVRNIRSGAVRLLQLIRESVHTFFADAPVDDLSELYNAVPQTPVSPSARSPAAEFRREFSFDLGTATPPAAIRDGTSEKFAFWAPGSNSLSSSHYLARLLALVGSAAGEIAALDVVKHTPPQTKPGITTMGVESLKSLVTMVRERCIAALCAAWLADAARCRVLETWHRSPERRDLTLMPVAFEAWMERVLSNVQKLAYVADARPASEVVVPPPAKLLGIVRSTFVTGLYKGLSGMVENAEGVKAGKNGALEVVNGKSGDDDNAVIRRVGSTAALRGLLGAGNDEEEITTTGMMMEAVDGEDKSVRLLLTLSNFLHLRAIAIPHLITHYETLFSVKLTDESKTLRDVLSQIDSRLFQSYTTPTAEKLTAIITAGINSRSWSPGNDIGTNRPKDVRPYIYTSLLTLVLVHAEVTGTIPPVSAAVTSDANSTSSPTTTTAPSLPVTTSPLIHRILTSHLTHASQTLLATFRKREKFSLADLIQATLDVEFFSQTLHAYASDQASSAQSDLYLAMDERTDHDARSALQSELPEMRAVLKRLKEGTRGEFSCFRRPAREPAGGSGEGRGRGRTVTNGAGAPARS